MKLLALAAIIALTSCVVTEEVATDGTIKRTKTPMPGTAELISGGLQIIAAK